MAYIFIMQLPAMIIYCLLAQLNIMTSREVAYVRAKLILNTRFVVKRGQTSRSEYSPFMHEVMGRHMPDQFLQANISIPDKKG